MIRESITSKHTPDVIGRGEHVGDADAGAGERSTEHERRLDLDLRVDQRAEVERRSSSSIIVSSR